MRQLEKEMASSHGKAQSTSMEILFLKAEKIVTREKYKNLSGLDAIRYFLIQKHNWLPTQVKTMSIEDLAFCLEEERT